MTSKAEFRVTGEQKIHCEGCEQRIDRALRRLPGVQDVEASAENQRVEVTLDPARVGADEVRDRLEFLGYRVELEGGAA